MLRFLGFTIVCFLLPFMAYAAWRLVRFGVVPGRESWPLQIWLRLAGAGVVAMLIAIGVLVSFQGGEAGRTYHPARFEDGQLIPGGFD